jgi:hypothetical protein
VTPPHAVIWATALHGPHLLLPVLPLRLTHRGACSRAAAAQPAATVTDDGSDGGKAARR